MSDDPELRAEAMRRLGDLELEANEAGELVENIESLDAARYDSAVNLYQQLLEAYPDYRRNDTVLYQLARAYEVGGRTDDALQVLDELVAKFPDTALIDEVQFRRGEMLFLRKRYNDAEVAYQAVRKYGDASRFYEQSLYKLGWSQFKLAWHEDSLDPFFELLDRKIEGVEIGEGDKRLASLKRAERELVEDTFRVLSISFSYMDGPQSIAEFLKERQDPAYGHVIYRNLGDLYLEKERFVDAAKTYEAFVEQDPFHPEGAAAAGGGHRGLQAGRIPRVWCWTASGLSSSATVWTASSGCAIRWRAIEAVASYLKSNLTDLAQYYHAEAQRGGNKSDYQQAANWYRKYLAYFPGEPDSANTNFLLAETLYEIEDYRGRDGRVRAQRLRLRSA